MKFELRDKMISVVSDHSVRHATLFGPTGKLSLKYDYASCFNDWENKYIWSFDLVEPMEPDQVFTFATADREVSCVVDAAGGLSSCPSPEVIRDKNQIPLRIAGTPTPKVTILIVTMDRRDLLEWTLWYIYETSTDAERNIWIWDNGSQDDTPLFLGSMMDWPGIRCFRSETNVGLVEGRKRMLPYVETPYIFTLDDDMWPLHKGWVEGVRRALDADPSIYQMALAITGHWHNNYGIVHTQLDRPFFRVPYIQPMPRSPVPIREAPPESEMLTLDGESVIVPVKGKKMPFAVSGSASGWRTADILPLISRADRHPVMDLSEAWGHVLRENRDRRDATICNYTVVSPCPGPLWHLGRNERYWEVRALAAPAIYNRTSEEQRSWLENARRASGWGRPLENPEIALPVKG